MKIFKLHKNIREEKHWNIHKFAIMPFYVYFSSRNSYRDDQ